MFCRFLFKNEKIPVRNKRKRTIAAVYVTIEFCVSRQTSKLIAKELCRDRKWEESNNSAETKKVYVATRFFSRMSTPERICRYKEAPLATNETGKKHKFCCDKESSITTLIIARWKSLLRQKKSFKERPLSRQDNVCRVSCRDTERRNICRDKVMSVATLKEEETLVGTDKQVRDV